MLSSWQMGFEPDLKRHFFSSMPWPFAQTFTQSVTHSHAHTHACITPSLLRVTSPFSRKRLAVLALMVYTGRRGQEPSERARACSYRSWWCVNHVSQPMRSVFSSERDLVLWGDAGLGGLLKVELLEAVECRGESESCKKTKGKKSIE